MKNFSDRLNTVLSGRKVNPWGKSLGMSGSVISAINGGTPPGADYLELIGLAEGASLNYLLTGKGTPFVVEQSPQSEVLEKVQQTTADDTIYIVHASGTGKSVIAFDLIKKMHIKTRTVEFKQFELIECTISNDLLHQCASMQNIELVLLDGPQLNALKKGLAGRYQCLGDANQRGLFTNRLISHEPERFNDFYQRILSDQGKNSDECPAQKNELDKSLLKAVLNLVDEVIADTHETITAEEKAKIIASLYSVATKQDSHANQLKPQAVLSMIEMLH